MSFAIYRRAFAQQMVEKYTGTLRYCDRGSHITDKGKTEVSPDDLLDADEKAKRSLQLSYGQRKLLNLPVHDRRRSVDIRHNLFQIFQYPRQLLIEQLQGQV